MYAKKNIQGLIEAISREPQDGFVWVDENAAEVQDYLQSLKSQNQLSLEQTDQSMVRVLEDVINLLIEKGVIRFTDLPEAAQGKLLNRRQLRDERQSVYVLGDDEDLNI